MTVCIGETLAQLPDRAQRLHNWAVAALAIDAGKAASVRSGTGNGTNVRTGAPAATKIRNSTMNSNSSSGGVFLLSHLRELPHVLIVNEWGLHHHRYEGMTNTHNCIRINMHEH